MGILSVIDEFLKRSDDFFKNLIDEKDLASYFVYSNLAILVLSAVYGATMGAWAGGLSILFSALKVPILLLISLYLTIPSYYVLYSLLGGKRTLRQTGILLLFSFTVMSTVLVALVPINLFFVITTTKSSNTYAFIVLVNVAIFALTGFFGLTNFVRGAKVLYGGSSENWKPAFLLGSLILMIVGTQLAWVLRPYFDYYPWFIRPLESNFYTAMVQLISQSIGPAGIFLIGLAIVVFIILLFAFTLGPAGNETPLRQPERSRQPMGDESGLTQNVP